jgi:hypothetical protein
MYMHLVVFIILNIVMYFYEGAEMIIPNLFLIGCGYLLGLFIMRKIRE